MRRLLPLLLLLLTAAAASAQVVGVGTFIHVVSNLDKTMDFYGERLGLGLTGAAGPRPFTTNEVIENLYDAKGSQSRVAVFKIPGSPLGLEFVEFKGIQQARFRPELQEPGASILALSVKDVDATLARLRDSTPILGRDRMHDAATIRDPDGFYIQLIHAKDSVPPASLTLITDSTGKTRDVYSQLLGFDFSGHRTTVPGTSFEMQLIPFKRPGHRERPPAIHDSGAGVIRLVVSDVDKLLQSLKAAGAPVASARGEAVDIGGRHFVILQDPDGFFFQLVPQPSRPSSSAVPAK